MNQANWEKFAATYRESLREAVQESPQEYAIGTTIVEGKVVRIQETALEYADRVAGSMLTTIERAGLTGVNVDSKGFRKACKVLGIKHTRKAIIEFLG